jgi:tetratricopeptide (TPR) repeat protein/tRNA A-37 threonylcarbamoyl transferase component Bud32
MRDSLTRVPLAIANPTAHSFVAPVGRKAVPRAFWQVIWRLERQQAGVGGEYGSQAGRSDIVTDIRGDLENLPPKARYQTMLRFLRISHHYQGSQNSSESDAIRQYHRQRFLKDVGDFAAVARRAYTEQRDPTYMQLFSNVRALASAGPEGLALSRDLAAIDPNNGRVQSHLAQDYLNANQHGAAAASAERAAALAPGDARPLTTLASARFAMQDYQGAHGAATRALRIDPGDKVAYSVQKLSRSHVPQAELQAKPQAPMWMEDDSSAGNAPQVYGAGGSRSQLSTPKIDVARNKESAHYANQARLELSKGDYAKALRLASKAIDRNPRNAPALYRRAVARYRLADYPAALRDTTSALRVMGDEASPVLLMMHSRVLNRMQRYEEALSAADRGLAAGPESTPLMAQLFYQKAWALSGMGRRKDAIHALAQAARLDSRFVPYYQEALEMPAEADLTSLFSGELLQEVRDAPASAGGGVTRQRMLMMMLLTLVGGFLVAFGFLHVTGQRGGAAVAAAPIDIAPPDESLIAGTYRVMRRIGAGGMGEVFEATDVHLQRRVAIKKMRGEIADDLRERERFITEARTVAGLRHDNIVEIFSVVGDPSAIYLVFEYVDGHTITDYINHYKRLPYLQALRILQGSVAALEFAHRRGVIHRDLKPSNIMITREGQVKVMDFGVARQAKDSLHTMMITQTITGTPPYMAPEQEQGKVCKESDVFSLAVCYYEMITGTLPFNGTGAGMSLAKLNKTYIRPSRIVSDLPQGLDEVFAWAFEPDPTLRCPTPARFLQALQSLKA